MSIGSKLVTGLFAGAAMGAVAGLLFAPKPGKETRHIVAARASELRDKADGYIDAMRSWKENRESRPVLAESSNGHVNGAT